MPSPLGPRGLGHVACPGHPSSSGPSSVVATLETQFGGTGLSRDSGDENMVTPRGTSPRGFHVHTRSNSNSQFHATPRQMLQNSLKKSASQVSLPESASLSDTQRSSSFTAATTSNLSANPAHCYKVPITPDDVAGLSAMAMDAVAAARSMPSVLLEAMIECDACHLRMHPDEMRGHKTFCTTYDAEFCAKVLQDSRCVVCPW